MWIVIVTVWLAGATTPMSFSSQGTARLADCEASIRPQTILALALSDDHVDRFTVSGCLFSPELYAKQ